jgi:hypothetical protein
MEAAAYRMGVGEGEGRGRGGEAEGRRSLVTLPGLTHAGSSSVLRSVGKAGEWDADRDAVRSTTTDNVKPLAVESSL